MALEPALPRRRIFEDLASRYTCPLVYAVIKTGGKQERVEEGQRVAVELLGAGDGEEVSFSPVLVVDGATVLATPGELAGATVSARVVGGEKGPKVRGFVYKPKTRGRRKWGHRQHYTTIEVTAITAAAATPAKATKPATATAEEA
jgi:large subunit ribosomal protein L21